MHFNFKHAGPGRPRGSAAAAREYQRSLLASRPTPVPGDDARMILSATAFEALVSQYSLSIAEEEAFYDYVAAQGMEPEAMPLELLEQYYTAYCRQEGTR